MSDARQHRTPSSLDPYLWAGGGAALSAISTALPWFAANLAPPFQAGASSGLASGMGPKLVLALSIVALIGSLCLVAAERAILLLGQSHVRALTAIVGLAAAAALAIVLYRTVKLPPPAGFVARQYGIYLAALGCLTTVITCSQQLLRPN